MMHCAACGHDSLETTPGIYVVDMGLDKPVKLANVPFSKCLNCGEDYFIVPHMKALHELIAQKIACKPSRLTPKEVRFLRKHQGLSMQQLAEIMNVSVDSVRRWETNGQKPIGGTASMLLRVLVIGNDLELWSSLKIAGNAEPVSIQFVS